MLRPLILLLALFLSSGCTALYSTADTWTSPDSEIIYQFNAEYRTGTTGRLIIIYVNGHKLMAGKAHYWSKRLTMTSELEGKPVAAECGGNDEKRTCTITVGGDKVALLKF
ncbi:MAG: hypothetical protein AB2689_05130 [Candidatus Thiodiazotropha taylori]|nr:MAG: hypothetical protein B6D73_04250 [gamma proteobacterium symbiont of Stewartia floridana]